MSLIITFRESQPHPRSPRGREPRRRVALLFGHLDGLVRGLLSRRASELRSGCSALSTAGRMGAVRTAPPACATFPRRSQVGSRVSAVVDEPGFDGLELADVTLLG